MLRALERFQARRLTKYLTGPGPTVSDPVHDHIRE